MCRSDCFVKVRLDVQRSGMGADIGERGLRGLFHHVAQLPRQLQALAACHLAGFNKDNIAAHRSPDKARHDARLFGALGDFLVLKARGAQVFFHLRGVYRQRVLPAFRELAGHFAADRGDLALQRPDPASRV